jgi:integrase
LAVRENYYRGEFGSVKASSRRRVVPLTPALAEALSAHRTRSAYRGPGDLVFCTRTGRPHSERNLLARAIKPAGEALGMPWLSWHVFRRTHATFGERIGMALADRQAQMGHGDPRMTLHYTHEDVARRRASLGAIKERLLGDETGAGPVLTLNDTNGSLEKGAKSLKRWYARQDSNLRPLAPEASALSS